MDIVSVNYSSNHYLKVQANWSLNFSSLVFLTDVLTETRLTSFGMDFVIEFWLYPCYSLLVIVAYAKFTYWLSHFFLIQADQTCLKSWIISRAHCKRSYCCKKRMPLLRSSGSVKYIPERLNIEDMSSFHVDGNDREMTFRIRCKSLYRWTHCLLLSQDNEKRFKYIVVHSCFDYVSTVIDFLSWYCLISNQSVAGSIVVMRLLFVVTWPRFLLLIV